MHTRKIPAAVTYPPRCGRGTHNSGNVFIQKNGEKMSKFIVIGEKNNGVRRMRKRS